MKKFVLLVLFCLLNISLSAQTVIQMEEYGGVYRIPCSVNGAKMKLIFDTGASNVSLSMAMAEYLLDNDFIKKEDFKGSGVSSTAAGTIVDHVKVIIKDIEIQGVHLYNVDAVVVAGLNAPLLMGQSAIRKLGPIEIDGSRLIIKKDNKSNKSAILTTSKDGYKYIDTYLDKELLLSNLRHNARGYVEHQGWDESKSMEFYEALELVEKAIEEGRLSSAPSGSIIDSAGILDNGTANWRDENGRVLSQEQYEKLSKKKKRKVTKDFYPNREVATFLDLIVRSLYEKSRES